MFNKVISSYLDTIEKVLNSLKQNLSKINQTLEALIKIINNSNSSDSIDELILKTNNALIKNLSQKFLPFIKKVTPAQSEDEQEKKALYFAKSVCIQIPAIILPLMYDTSNSTTKTNFLIDEIFMKAILNTFENLKDKEVKLSTKDYDHLKEIIQEFYENACSRMLELPKSAEIEPTATSLSAEQIHHKKPPFDYLLFEETTNNAKSDHPDDTNNKNKTIFVEKYLEPFELIETRVPNILGIMSKKDPSRPKAWLRELRELTIKRNKKKLNIQLFRTLKDSRKFIHVEDTTTPTWTQSKIKLYDTLNELFETSGELANLLSSPLKEQKERFLRMRDELPISMSLPNLSDQEISKLDDKTLHLLIRKEWKKSKEKQESYIQAAKTFSIKLSAKTLEPTVENDITFARMIRAQKKIAEEIRPLQSLREELENMLKDTSLSVEEIQRLLTPILKKTRKRSHKFTSVFWQRSTHITIKVFYF